MTPPVVTFRGGLIFDGAHLRDGLALRLDNGVVTALDAEDRVPRDGQVVDLDGDILAPGYVDLQVNGGGDVLVNRTPTAQAMADVAAAHKLSVPS